MNPLLEAGLRWLSQPETIIAAITFALTIPQYIQKVKDAKGKNVIEKALEVAKEEALKLTKENLTNDKKRAELENRILNAIPERDRKHIDQEKIKIIAEGVYKAVVKPRLQ